MPNTPSQSLRSVNEAHEPLLDDDDSEIHASEMGEGEQDSQHGLINGKINGHGSHGDTIEEPKKSMFLRTVAAIFLILVAVVCWVAEIMLTEVRCVHVSWYALCVRVSRK
jgi:hypothetical protein